MQSHGARADPLIRRLLRWNDLIFLVLFIAHLGGFIAISVIALRALGSDSLGDFGGSSIAPTAQTAYLLAIIAVTGLVLSVLMLLLVRVRRDGQSDEAS